MRQKSCFLFFLFIISCGENLLKDFSSTKNDHYYLEEAKNFVREEKYSQAQTALDALKHKSSEAHMLQVVVYLGASGFSLWGILLDIADKLTSGSSSGSGMESVYNALSGQTSVFGTGQARFDRLSAIAKSIAYLIERFPAGSVNLTADENRLDNMRCLLAGVLMLPTTSDTTSSIQGALAALAALPDNLAKSGGSCPDLSAFSSAMDQLALVQANLSLILLTSSGCTMLDFLTQSGAIDQLANTLLKLSTNADKGCTQTLCGSSAVCQALAIPCVGTLLSSSEAKAGDGLVNRCEILQNCQNPSDCF